MALGAPAGTVGPDASLTGGARPLRESCLLPHLQGQTREEGESSCHLCDFCYLSSVFGRKGGRISLKSGSGLWEELFLWEEGEVAAPLLPRASTHTVLKWAPPATPPLPHPCCSHCLLLSWQPRISVFFSSTDPGRQREEGWWVAAPPSLSPFSLEMGSPTPPWGGSGMGTRAVNSTPGSARSPLLS